MSVSISGRAVSISNSSENAKRGAKRGAKADSYSDLEPRPKSYLGAGA